MQPHIIDLIRRYERKGAIIDSNLLLLIVIGQYNCQRIMSHRRTRSRGYTIPDFEIMMRVISEFERIYTTPNILTEVDNLSRAVSNQELRGLSGAMRSITSKLIENYINANSAANLQEFESIGLTDSGILILSAEDLLTITDDLPLAQRLEHLHRPVINLNHLRPPLSRLT